MAEDALDRTAAKARPADEASPLRYNTPQGPVSIPGLARRLIASIPYVIVAVAVFVAIAGPTLSGVDPFEQDLLNRNQGPSDTYLLGTDHLGRDVLARLIVGTRLSLEAGLGGVLVALLLGGLLGFAASAAGGPAETTFYAFVDLIRAMPGVLLALLLVVALGAGLGPVTIALGVTFAPIFAYVARATYHRELAMDYVTAAESFGAGRWRILFTHILPNVSGAFVTQATIVLPRCIVTESVLSFLGLGVEPDTPTWGRMIAQAAQYIERNPVAVLAPVIALSVLTISLALLGDRLRLRLDPRRLVDEGARP